MRAVVVERQPEIEIYVRDCPKTQLTAWLVSVIGPLGQPEVAGTSTTYPSAIGPVVVTSGIEDGPFVSVWFNTPHSPWATDVDCARQAARELRCAVRCCPGKCYPKVHLSPEAVLEIEGDSEGLTT